MEFEEFLTANLGRLARYAGVLAGDRQLAHDVLAQALITVWPSWDRIGAMEHPLAYVRAAVTTTFLDHHRLTRRRKTFSTDSDELLDTGVASDTRQVDDLDEIDGLLRRLPDRQRAVLVMRYYLDLPDQQIADELGCSLATVRSSAARGLAAVRAIRSPVTG